MKKIEIKSSTVTHFVDDELDVLINKFVAWRLANKDNEVLEVTARYQCETDAELFWQWMKLYVK